MGVIARSSGNASPRTSSDALSCFSTRRRSAASGYHVLQSQVAIGSGGWFGKGYTLGTQKRLAFPPRAAHGLSSSPSSVKSSDSSASTLALTLFPCSSCGSCGWRRARTTPSAVLVAFGLGASWFVHVVVNVGMTLNLMPITGIPLPFFSYGGSFMLASWLAIGILSRISSEGAAEPIRLAV
jgi:rod shape determining protein RodA